MPDYLPKFPAGPVVTFSASAAVTGGRVVAVSGARTVAHAGVDSAAVVGVAARDAASGEPVAVHLLPGAVHRLVASGAIAAGARVATAADGTVSTIGAAVNAAGLALTSAAAAGDVIEVLGY